MSTIKNYRGVKYVICESLKTTRQGVVSMFTVEVLGETIENYSRIFAESQARRLIDDIEKTFFQKVA